jgi:hypothetical protein
MALHLGEEYETSTDNKLFVEMQVMVERSKAADFEWAQSDTTMTSNHDSLAENPSDAHEIDPIWTSSRTARQIYALGEVEKVCLSLHSILSWLKY